MLANIIRLLSKDGVNVANLSNKSRDAHAYTVVDLDTRIDHTVVDDVKALDGVIRVRVIE